jgi:hypothetical protein
MLIPKGNSRGDGRSGNFCSKKGHTATEEEFHDMCYEYQSLLSDPSDGTMLHGKTQI